MCLAFTWVVGGGSIDVDVDVIQIIPLIVIGIVSVVSVQVYTQGRTG